VVVGVEDAYSVVIVEKAMLFVSVDSVNVDVAIVFDASMVSVVSVVSV